MLVEDPVFSGDKEKHSLFHPVSRDQHPVSLHYLHHNILKLDINFNILAYIDT